MDQVIDWLKESVVTWSNIIFAVIWMVVGILLTWPIKKSLAYLRAPRIELAPDKRNPITVIFKREMITNDKGTKNYVLRLIVKNVRWEDWTIGKIIPKCEWTRTRKADKCYFVIYFFDQAGNTVCQEPMLARISLPNHVYAAVYGLPMASRDVDIYPNQEFYLDLAIKLEESNECYGLWHQNAYSCVEAVIERNVLISRHEAYWRETDEIWRLESGIYKIMIKTYTDGQILKQDYFQLKNLPEQFKVKKIAKFKHVS